MYQGASRQPDRDATKFAAQCVGQRTARYGSAWLRKYAECVPGDRAVSLGCVLAGTTPRITRWPTHVTRALKSGSNLNYPETVPFGSSSDLKRSSILSKLSSWPSDLVIWSRPALSRNASFIVSFVIPLASCRSTDSTASASGHPSNSHVATVRVGGSTSK